MELGSTLSKHEGGKHRHILLNPYILGFHCCLERFRRQHQRYLFLNISIPQYQEECVAPGMRLLDGFCDVQHAENGNKRDVRGHFATKSISFLDKNNVDGIDFDWEYPGPHDIPGTPLGSPIVKIDATPCGHMQEYSQTSPLLQCSCMRSA